MDLSTLPRYNDNLADFLWALRSALGFTQAEAAQVCYLDRSRIARYENLTHTDKPRPGYMAVFARQIAQQRDDETTVCEHLRNEVNKALRQGYNRRGFRNWAELDAAADDFLIKQQNRRRPKSDTAIDAWNAMLDKRLPPTPKTELFGVESCRQQLLNAIVGAPNAWTIGVEGLGGMGKTARLDTVMRDPLLSRNFKSVAWVRVGQQSALQGTGSEVVETPQSRRDELLDMLLDAFDLHSALTLDPGQKARLLTEHVEDSPHIIVVDNLETAADVETLVPFLSTLANPSKVLIASRHNLAAFPAVMRIRVQPLAQPDALALMRSDARFQASALAATISDEQLGQIYATVGGNPMALKLVVRQVVFLAFDETLAILSQVRDEEVDEFYTHIYQRSWDALDEPSRMLFAVMPLMSDGTRTQLSALTPLDRTEINAALRQLERLLLIEVSGTADEPRYRIHRLTEVFLLKQIVGWQRDDDNLEGAQPRLFHNTITRNVDYWRQWLPDHGNNIERVDRARAGIVKAIDFGLDARDAWSSVYGLIEAFTGYMERSGHWEVWGRILAHAIHRAETYAELAHQTTLAAISARLLMRQQAHYGDAIARFRQAIRLTRLGGDEYNRARCYSNLGYLYTLKERWVRAEVLCQAALRIFTNLEDDHGLAHTHNHLGVLYGLKGNWAEGQYHLQQACAIWEEVGNESGLTSVYTNLGWLLNDMQTLDLKPLEDPLTFLTKALRLAKKNGDKHRIALIYTNMGIVYRLNRHFAEAESLFLNAQKIFDGLLDSYNGASTLNNLGLLCTSQFNWSEADEYFRQALQIRQSLHDLYGETRVMIYQIEKEIACGDMKQARYWLQQVDALFVRNPQTEQYGWHQAKLKGLRPYLS